MFNDEQRSTLSLPQTRNNPPMPAAQQPRAEDRRKSAPTGMVAKGHDRILKDFQDRGAKIEITTLNCEIPYVGKMFNRDRYTITIEVSGGPTLPSKRLTIYKHAIESFAERV